MEGEMRFKKLMMDKERNCSCRKTYQSLILDDFLVYAMFSIASDPKALWSNEHIFRICQLYG